MRAPIRAPSKCHDDNVVDIPCCKWVMARMICPLSPRGPSAVVKCGVTFPYGCRTARNALPTAAANCNTSIHTSGSSAPQVIIPADIRVLTGCHHDANAWKMDTTKNASPERDLLYNQTRRYKPLIIASFLHVGERRVPVASWAASAPEIPVFVVFLSIQLELGPFKSDLYATRFNSHPGPTNGYAVLSTCLIPDGPE